jgi:Tol biopolymer transport system component
MRNCVCKILTSWFIGIIAAFSSSLPRGAHAETKICVMNADGTGIRTLADLPGHTFHGSPCWSHDGKQIAFDATIGGAQNDHIFIVDAAGGEPHDLGLGSQPSWSGDDKQICFFTLSNNPAGETVGVWLMNADGKSRQYLMPGMRSRWSNDGGKIAYLNYSNGVNISVYSILDAETKTLLNERFVNISPPAWSEDGKQICFVGLRAGASDYELCVADVEGENKITTKYKENVNFYTTPCWSPSKEILFGVGAKSTAQPRWLDPTQDNVPTKIECAVAGFSDPSWSPDGKQIAFRCEK